MRDSCTTPIARHIAALVFALSFVAPAFVPSAAFAADAAAPAPKSADDFAWLRGANLVPSYARNDVQAWLEYDAATVDRDLALAEKLALSDVVSFHFYGNYEGLRRRIAELKTLLRPVINTEWMARLQGSTWETDLPLFKREAVAWYNWGLVNGRAQFQFAWWDKRGAPEPKVWFHDIFRRDGTPYDPAEHAVIRATASFRSDSVLGLARANPEAARDDLRGGFPFREFE